MVQQETVSWTEPVLCHYNFDTTKAWFVSFTFTDKLLGKTVRKQYRNGINYTHNREERFRQGNALISLLKDKLKQGWNPITGTTGMPTDAPMTIRDAYLRVLELKQSSLKPKSYRNYKDISGMFLKWAEEYGYDNYLLHRFNKKLAQAYMDYLLVERSYSGKSHNGQLGIHTAFCNVMVNRWKEALPVNPFAGIELLPESTGRNVAYSEDEARALMAWLRFRDIRLYYAANIMFHCYIRKTELCELRVRDFNFKERTITVNSDAAKNRTQDSVTMPEGLMPILEEMKLQAFPPDHYVFGHLMETSRKKICKADVLSDKHLKYIRECREGKKKALAFSFENEEAYNAVRVLAEDKTFYSWKHTGVVLYWSIVKDVYYMMRQLRHSDMKTTMIYLKSLGLMPNEAFRNAKITL